MNTVKYKMILNICENILKDNEKNTENCVDYPNNHHINNYILNKYNLNIPHWVSTIINYCCSDHPYFALVIFEELMNSISARKFNDNPIPSNYIITVDDWADCYEDGYPICIEGNSDYIYEYNMSFTSIIKELSHDDLVKLVLQQVQN